MNSKIDFFCFCFKINVEPEVMYLEMFEEIINYLENEIDPKEIINYLENEIDRNNLIEILAVAVYDEIMCVAPDEKTKREAIRLFYDFIKIIKKEKEKGGSALLPLIQLRDNLERTFGKCSK